MLTLGLVSLAVLAYVLVGYPILLRMIVRLRGARPVRRQEITPSVSFVISAFNEAAVIRGKIENTLELDYPAAVLEIVVISDRSDDDTDRIVLEYAARGVRLARQPERRGKTAGLNRTVPELKGDVVVFSDANAMYETDALRKLVRNFADPEVGCVTGEARYLKNGQTAADEGERAYWGYEIQMKRLETQLGSMVGGDGAIYAIRRSLWQTLPEDAINDFLNPLQIVAAGWRGVYEPDAVCYEETAGGIRTEYKRRVRIVSRSWRAVFQVKAVLNPFSVGLFAWSVCSHKVLRWLSGIFVAGVSVAFVDVYVRALLQWPVVVTAITAAAMVAAAMPAGRRLLGLTGYFAVVNYASLVGICKGSLGRVSGVWSTPREAAAPKRPLLPVGPLFLGSCGLTAIGIVVVPAFVSMRVTTFVFWLSLALLGYVYVAYPLLLALLRVIASRPHRKAAIEPTVCLFIAANDEASVIEAKLKNALALDYPPDRFDIVVASDGSVDGTNAIVRSFAPRVRLLEFSPRQGKISAINRGLSTIGSEIVVLSDANTFLEPNSVRALVANFADPAVGCASGDVVLVGDRAALGSSEDLYYLYERWIQHAESDIGSMIGADGALYAVRRRLFVAPAADTILDDMAIPMGIVRSGHRVVFEPYARAHEQGVETAREEFSRKARVVAGAIQFLTRRDSAVPLNLPQVILSMLSHKALRWLSPAFATSVFLASVALAGASHEYAAAAAAQGALVLLGIVGCVPRLRRVRLIGLAHYFCLVQSAAAVGMLQGLTGRQSVLWRRSMRYPAKQVRA